jgi:DNA polymerase-3 subunit epsilon
MEFVAIDVETANADMASICQIGIAHFENSVLTDEWKTYVDPQDHFDGMNVSIHGIDEDVVAGSPTFGMLAHTVMGRLNGRIVVTHTAFDRVAIYRAGAKCETSLPTCTWLDSACVVRRAWKEFSKSGYGLASVCDSIGYKFKHHDALEDAKAAGSILLAAITHTGLNLDAWLTRVRRAPNPG